LKASEFTAITISLNSIDRLEIMLKSLRSSFSGEIITIDGTSYDGSFEIAKKYSDIALQTPRGCHRQISAGVEKCSSKFVILAENDIFYKKDFINSFIEEYLSSDFEVMQSKVSIENTKTIWEFFHKLFLDLHQVYPKERFDISGPSIWPKKLLIKCLKDMDGLDCNQSLCFDTSISEFLKKNSIFSGYGETSFPESVDIDFARFMKRHINYGIGDYEFYRDNRIKWNLIRKMMSLTHVFRKYWIMYPIKAIRFGINPIVIPYLVLIGLVRNYGFLKSILKNLFNHKLLSRL